MNPGKAKRSSSSAYTWAPTSHDLRPFGANAGNAAALGAGHPCQLGCQVAHVAVSASGLPLATRPAPVALLLRMAWLASVSAAAVPEVAITSETRRAPKRLSALRSSRAINCFKRASSSSVGGSLGRNSLVRRTAPRGRLIVSRSVFAPIG